jgi:hypothetical protein
MALLCGYAALVTIGSSSGTPPVNTNQLLYWEMPLRWDAGWYVAIAKSGYEWRGSVNTQQNLNFFPAYPWLVRVAALLVPLRNVPLEVKLAWTGTLLSVVAFACALIYIHKIVAGWLDADTARVAILLLATYPFALFYSAVYSEALFMLAVAGAWYHLERSQNRTAMVWGLLAGLSRPNGLLLTPVLIAIAFSKQRRNPYAYVAALGPLAGMFIFSFVGYRLSGHPFIWAELQRGAWSRTFQGLDRTLGEELSAVRDLGVVEYVAVRPFEAFNLAAALLACGSLWPVGRRLGFAAGFFVAVNTLVPLLNGGLAGMGRYTSLLFPMFVWLALCQRRSGASLLVGCFGAGQALLAALFFTGRPVM